MVGESPIVTKMTPTVSVWHYGCMVAISKDPAEGLNGAVAAELRAERAAQRMTVDTLVARSGVSRSTLLRVLNAERAIAVESLQDIARALGVASSTLVRRAERRLESASAAQPAEASPELRPVVAPGHGERVECDSRLGDAMAALDYGVSPEQEAEDQASFP